MAEDSTVATIKLARRALHETHAAPTPFTPVDATVDVVTPENISFNYRAAGPFRRLPAFLIDLMLRGLVIAAVVAIGWIILILLSFISMLAGTIQLVLTFAMLFQALLLVLWFVLEAFYGGLFETMWNGQTPGKRLMGIRVLTTEGKPINGMQGVLRNLLRYVEFTPLLLIQTSETGDIDGTLFPVLMLPLLIGIVPMMLNRNFQRIGDLVCGTIVVMEERNWLMGVVKVEDPRTPKLAEYLPPKYPVSRSLARALAAYVERRRYFSIPRRREIARHLGEPLLREFGLPPDTSHDLLLCALYYKTFIADRERQDEQWQMGAAYGTQQMPQPMPQGQPEGITFLPPPPLPQEQMAGSRLSEFHIRR